MNTESSHENELLLNTVRSFMEEELFPHEEEVDRLGYVSDDLGRQIESRAKEIGLITRVVPEPELDEAIADRVAALLAAAPEAQVAIKGLIRTVHERPADARESTAAVIAELRGSSEGTNSTVPAAFGHGVSVQLRHVRPFACAASLRIRCWHATNPQASSA